ncbi:hypothetical protein ACI65C_006767 [Semiaphis heraclei]
MEFVDSVASVDITDWRFLGDGQWLTGGAIDACVKVLLDSEWSAIVKNNEYSYLFDYNYDSFYKTHDISCNFEESKTFKINDPSIVYAIGSECLESDCNAMFLCVVVFSNLKNMDLGVTVIAKYFGDSCPHKPLDRAYDDDVLHSN